MNVEDRINVLSYFILVFIHLKTLKEHSQIYIIKFNITDKEKKESPEIGKVVGTVRRVRKGELSNEYFQHLISLSFYYTEILLSFT